MKIVKQMMMVISIITIMVLIGCASKSPTVRVVELETKGTSMGIETPQWVRTYIEHGISRVQAAPEFRDKYCIIGEESGVNRQFVLAWADNFSAQQRIGAMLRTNIASEYQARVQAAAQSIGGANSSTSAGTGSGEYQQEINNIISAVVNVSYSGAQRENDWWILRRRYDPDQRDVFSDEYTAFVLYTIPKSQLNQQIAQALETAVNADSALYDITIQLAREILLNGVNYLGEGELISANAPQQTQLQALNTAGPTGNITIQNTSSDTGSVLSRVNIYAGFEARGVPLLTYDSQVLGGQQASWNLPEGTYTVEVFMNNNTNGRTTTVGVTAGSNFLADFFNGYINSFTRRR